MQPSWARSREPPSLGSGDQQLTRGLSAAWSQLGKARKELRRMEHRLEDAHTAFESAASGSNPSSGVTSHAAYHVNAHSLPTARFVDATSPVRGSSKSSNAKRKVSRLDDKDYRTAPSASSSPLSRQERHRRERSVRSAGDVRTRRARSPPEADIPGGGATAAASSATAAAALPTTNAKRVDFSQRLRLREVDRDGTYRDTVAHQQHHHHPAYHPLPHNNNHNHLHPHRLPQDRYDPDLDLDLPCRDRDPDPDFNRHPLTYPYPATTSLSHSDLDQHHNPHQHHHHRPYSSQSQPEDNSTLTDSRAVRETEIRFLNDTFATLPLHRPRDLDDHEPHRRHHHHHLHPSEGRSKQLRLTRVAVDPPGGGSGSRSSKERGRGHAERAAGSERRSAATTTSSSSRGSGPESGSQGGAGHGGYGVRGALLPAGAGREMSAAPRAGGGGSDMGDSSGGDSGEPVAGAVGGAEGSASSTRGFSARMQKIKRTLKELPQDDNILSQLREKIRQQRLSASSTDTSQNDSLASSLPTSEASRDVTPHHTLHDTQEPVRHGDDGFIAPEKMPRSRKVAAGPPAPTYQGFSEVHLDTQLQATVKQVNRLTSSKRRSGSSHNKSPDPVQNAIQTQIRAQHPGAASSSVVPASTSTPNSKTGDRKVYRVIAHGKKPPKPGAKNLITTSSWRAGQELIARELGLPKPRSKDEHKRAGGSSEQARLEGAEGNTASGGRPPAEGATRPSASAPLAQSRALSEDAKKLYSDLQLDNKERASSRSAVKRKAPKVEKEVEKPDPVEKQRHYDADSVRQFMAKQKAQRQRQKEEARKTEELEQQKRQKLMKELITKQKSAVASTTNATTTAVTKPKKVKRAGKGKQRVLFPSDHESFDQRIRALLGADAENPDQRSMEMDEDDNSDDTLTGDSEGSTPRATPLHIRDDHLGGPASNYNNDNNIRPHHGDHRLNTTITTSTNTAAATGPAASASSSQPGSTINFHGNTLNMDVNSVLARFSQVVSQRHTGGGSLVSASAGGAVEAGSAGTSAERSRQERLQGLKSSALTLQSKIVTASSEIQHAQKETRTAAETDDSSSEAEFVPRYDRIAGSRDDFNVFTSNLPGAQNVVARATSNNEKTPVAAAQTVSTSQRDSVSAAFPRAAAVTVTGNEQGAEDDYSVTETSTFSEVTAADDWEAETPKRKAEVGRSNTSPQAADTGGFSAVQYRTPTGTQTWEKPRSDPYSALNVFSRQQRYGIRGPGRPDRQSNNRGSVADSFSQSESTRLKEPRVTSSQQVVFGQSAEGHPTMMRTTYTRMEATLPDHSHASQPSMSARNRASRSEDRGERHHQSSYASRNRSTSEDTLESEEEATPKAASNRMASKKSAIDYRRQTSDTGQETDVSQLSEDEPRLSHRTYDRPIVDTTQEEVGEARWSPAALERQMAAELARLESLEDSIRQLSSAERTRAVALAQQETVSVAQVLKARQQEHSAELRSLQMQVQEERLAAANQLQQHVNIGVQAPASDMSSLAPARLTRHTAGGSAQLIEQAENLRPDAKGTTATSVSRSRGRDDTEYSETFTTTRVTKSASSVSPSRSAASCTPTSRTSSVRTAQDSAASVRTAEDSATESIKTAEDSQADSDASVKTASDADRHSPDVSAAPEEVPDDGDYSLSFEESMTEDESFKQAKGNRRDARRPKNNKPSTEDVASYRLNDLTSASFNQLSADIIRNILREEEMRAAHQESLLRIRMKALKEKTRTQLSLVEQERQAVKSKGSEETRERELKRLAEKEKAILREQAENQADIDRLIKTEKLAKEHRQSLLKQHEQIAKMQKKTREKMHQLQGKLDGADEVPTEDETSVMEDLSDVSDVSYAKDSKSETEVTQRKAKVRGDKQKMEKQQKLRLDQKYLTVREQQLMERKKNASELLHWKKMLDAEEKKVIQMERTALKAWDDYEAPGTAGDKKRDGKREDTQSKVTAPGNLRPEPAARLAEPVTPRTARSESAVTPRTARSESAVTPRSALDSYTPFSGSEAVSTHISASETDHKQSATESSTSRSRAQRSRSSAASESSVPEDIPDGGSEATRRSAAAASPDRHQHHDSSDDTIINSSVNEEEDVESTRRKGKKSPVGRLLSPEMAKPLPQLWSHKTGGSESESEESMSHTETLSDVSDYEVRIHQLNDMLRRRRKEAESLKKERSKRQKEKLRAQEESLKKQVEAYETYIAQVKTEQADLEREGNKPTVPPKIKQPHASKTRTSPSASPSPGRPNQRDDPNYSSSFEGTDSNQTSPALSEGKDSKVSPLAEKVKKQMVSSTSTTIMDRISEASESQSSDRSQKEGKAKTSTARSISDEGSLSEAIEEAADSATASENSRSAPIMNIKTSVPSKADEENLSYTEDFSNTASVSKSLAKSQSKIPVSIRSEASQASVRSAVKTELSVSEAIESAVSTAKSDSSSAPKLDLTKTSPAASAPATPAAGKDTNSVSGASSRPATGIQESDSESESRINSHRTLSRPSSERSTGSTTYSDLHDFDEVEGEEEEDIISSESERTPVKVSVSHKEKSVAQSVRTEEDISEQISVSLPSISEKKTGSQATALGRQDSIDAVLGDLLGEEDATPTHTPRAESPHEEQESLDPLLMTDPLADFHTGDPVLVGGHLKGTLRFKGPVSFAPGFWAGVELDTPQGDTNGHRDGKRYFTCRPDYGMLVPGSEISTLEEEEEVEEAGAEEEESVAKSPDESLTDHDEVSSATEGEKSESSARLRPARPYVATREEEEAITASASATQNKTATPPASRPNLDLLADDITADLTRSLMEDSVVTMNSIATRQSSLQKSPPPAQKTPPPTLPKPKMPQDTSPPLTPTSPTTKSKESSPPPTLPKPKLSFEQQQEMEQERNEEMKREAQKHQVDSTTSSVVGGLLDDAISKMMQIRRGRLDSAENQDVPLVNGYSDNDSGVVPSHDNSLEKAVGISPEPELGDGEGKDLNRPISPQRPKSPVPVINSPSEAEQDDDYDFTGLMGDDQDFFEDDFGLSAKPPPPYPGSGDQSRGGRTGSPVPAPKPSPSTNLFIIPHSRSEVDTIVADAVEVYWNLRRCGEPWESATPPPEYMAEHGTTPDGASAGEQMEGMVSGSRRTFRQLVFDLTGEIVRDIYAHENDVEPPPWQKPTPRRRRYFKPRSPPTTMDALLPIVQSTITDIFGLNGCSGRYRGQSANKWNVRKKKDHVDAVLVEELREEEVDWVNYDNDELAVKMQLTETIFESLLADTVATLNTVYAKRQRRLQAS